MKPLLKLIVACNSKGVIGVKNKLPWHLPEDLKNFKNLTTGHSIVMGRKTALSLKGPLPNRLNLVLSHQPDFIPPHGFIKITKLTEALEHAPSGIIFLIGGAQIYKAYASACSEAYVTQVDWNGTGDTFFQLKDWTPDFELLDSSPKYFSESAKLGYQFFHYKKMPSPS